MAKFYLCTCVKDEGAYLLEWIAYHRLCGVDGFLIYDNESTDGTADLLARLERVGVVDYVPWKTRENASPQLAAFNDAIGRLRGKADFVGNLDADEFLAFDPPKVGWVQKFFSGFDPSVGAICVNQRVFGSSGLTQYSPAPVTSRFVRASAKQHSENHFYKTIYRPDHASHVSNPHFVHLKSGAAVHVDGSPVSDMSMPGSSKDIRHEPLSLHHYILKSQEEFGWKKRRGGGASATKEERINRYENDSFFVGRDQCANVVEETALRSLGEKLEAEMARLANLAALQKIETPSAETLPTGPAEAHVTISDVPAMEAAGIEVLSNRLGTCKTFIEYGAGGSTVLAAKLGVSNVISVETHENFLKNVIERARTVGSGQFYPRFVDVGPTKEWGYPVDTAAAVRWPAYSISPWEVAQGKGLKPDLVLVDGRFRVTSFLTSVMLAEPGTVILFDDYAERNHYHVVADLLAPIALHGRMAEFVVPASVRRDKVMFLLFKTVMDPR